MSDHRLPGTCHGSVISVQWLQGPRAQDAHSARGGKYASTIRWQLNFPWWPRSGTMKQMLVLAHLALWCPSVAAGWVCHDCSHKRTAVISNCVQKQTGCPKCEPGGSMRGQHSSRPAFADSQHPLLAQWDHKRNAAQGNFPHNTTEASTKQIYWLCPNCPAGQEHSWAASPNHRASKPPSGCPFCSGRSACKCNSLEALYPDTAAEWDYGKNTGRPCDYTAGSAHQTWWQIPAHGSWQQAIFEHTVQADRNRASAQLGKDRTRFDTNVFVTCLCITPAG